MSALFNLFNDFFVVGSPKDMRITPHLIIYGAFIAVRTCDVLSLVLLAEHADPMDVIT